MPIYQMEWANASNPGAEQDWILGGDLPHQEFTLPAGFLTDGQLDIQDDATIQVAVDTNAFAAASLNYVLASDTWTLQTNTPNEFALAVVGNTVTLSCFLTQVERPARVRYDAKGSRVRRADSR